MLPSAADASASAAAPPARKRLGRREKAERRAKEQPGPGEVTDKQAAAAVAAKEVDTSTAVWPWHSLAESVSATVPVVFSQDCS